MFTGIIDAIGAVADRQQIQSEWRLTFATGKLALDDVKIGDSIAVNGCCLTVIESGDKRFSADVSNETLNCTTLGELQVTARVNMEKAMLATDRFGGHIVSGHVDGVGKLIARQLDAQSVRLQFEATPALMKYIAAKGSICIDGTSLTVNEVDGVTFSINVIPHTQNETVAGNYTVGQRVNLEVDLIARYLERLMQMESDTVTDKDRSKIDREFLALRGFQ